MSRIPISDFHGFLVRSGTFSHGCSWERTQWLPSGYAATELRPPPRGDCLSVLFCFFLSNVSDQLPMSINQKPPTFLIDPSPLFLFTIRLGDFCCWTDLVSKVGKTKLRKRSRMRGERRGRRRGKNGEEEEGENSIIRKNGRGGKDQNGREMNSLGEGKR